MTGPDPHPAEELGAHALGLLDPTAARAVEEHLDGCESCRTDHAELVEMTELLGDVPPEALLDGPPDGDLVLARALRQVRAETGARRRRRRSVAVGAAAAALVVVLGGGVLVGRSTAPATPPGTVQAAGTVSLEGTGGSGARLQAAVSPAAGWVRLTAMVSGVPAGERCRLVVVARDGRREVAGGWLVSPAGERDGTTLAGSAIVALDQVAAVVVENEAGREFAVARV